MSDHDATPDPIDRAYAQAEVLLDDEAARAARRAGVLGAVAAAAAPAAAASAPSRTGAAWRRGGWLVAASVAGLSVLFAVQVLQPASVAPPAAAPTGPVPVSPAPAVTEEASPPLEAVAPPAKPTSPAPAVARRAPEPARPEVPPAAPPPSYESRAPAPPPAAAPASAPSGARGIDELVVSASRIPSERGLQPGREPTISLPAQQAAKLRDAAAAGRVAEVRALLAEGVPVDAADDKGQTALMRSVAGNHPAVAALLRRHGADLDRRNRAGTSTRDMATAIGDAELDRALGLSR